MKRNYLLAVGAFVGFFSLGTMFSPISNSSANGINPMDSKNMSVIQTANEKGAPQQGQEELTCPKTGEAMGNIVGMRNMAGMGMAGSMRVVISEALGITVDEYQEARQEGLSIAELAEQKGVKAEELVELMIESRKIQLEKLVKEGKLTQEQMDLMFENIKPMIERAIDRDGKGPMQGCGMGQSGRWNSDVNPSRTNIELEL